MTSRPVLTSMSFVAALAASATARADGELSLYKSKDLLVIGFFVPTGDGTDDKDPLRARAEAMPAKGPVAALTCDPNKLAGKKAKKGWGCYLGVKRDGSVARAELKSQVHLPQLDASFTSKEANGSLDVKITGPAADALALWLDCADGSKHARGMFACDPPTETDSSVRFVMLDGGGVKPATPK
jgi:hypothetical protein